jgi:hypothetical protein
LGAPTTSSYRRARFTGYAQPYSLISVSAPLGIGVRYKLNHNFDLGLEIGYRFTMTDYLDDVGGFYADPADLGTQSALSVAMANRTLERTAAYSGKDRTNGVINYLTSIGVYNPGSGVDPFTYSSVPGFQTVLMLEVIANIRTLTCLLL